MALIAALVTGVIAFLATYQTSQHVDSLTENLRGKAATYGALVGKQATSAVAFSDRATAREVLASVLTDPDVTAIVLYGEEHEQLYIHGDVSPWVAKIEDVSDRVLATTGRITAITAVRPLEGPRGLLVIQLSTRSLDVARARARETAVATGLFAFAFGLVFAWWIAGRIARRLRAIAAVAATVAAGDFEVPPIDPSGHDEISLVVRAFNAMVAQLRQLLARQRHHAKREQERLEALVVARTVALDRRNLEMRLIFDHIDQGLLTVSADGTIASEHSASIERLLGPIPASGRLVDYVREFAPLAADWFEMSWEFLAAKAMPIDLCLAQLPSRFTVDGRHLHATYKHLSADGKTRVLIVVSDVTAVVEREHAERDEREVTTLVTRMLHDRTSFMAFCSEADRHVAAIEQEPHERERLRLIHTLKGTAAIEGISSLSELCHELETAYAEHDREGTVALAKTLTERWALLRAKVAPLLEATTERLDLSLADLDRLELAIARARPLAELESLVASWRHDRVAPRLERYADQVRILASRLCKDPIEVRVDADPDLRLPTGRFRGFWSTFVHAIRNAVDHGIETSSERALAGKPGVALITFRAHRRHGETTIQLEDHGRGIDWDAIAAKARSLGIPSETPGDLEDALCHDGLSTRDQIDEVSGRGIGFGAFRQACHASGARLAIASTRGIGTTLTVTWSDALLATPVTSRIHMTALRSAEAIP